MVEESCMVKEAAKIYSGIIDNAKKGTVFGSYAAIINLLKESGCSFDESLASDANFDAVNIFVKQSEKAPIVFFHNPNDRQNPESASMAYSVLSAIFNCYGAKASPLAVSPSVDIDAEGENINIYLTFKAPPARDLGRIHKYIELAKDEVQLIYSNVSLSL